ncbi:hypothetical protein CSUI_009181 [Cystoisospora suis]|uniref:SRS domain-containing protein n=1 Tax=Cystoisospora suis TaxID=483139 RepID=A0A2C6JIZ0_9APIC|nr:hypothetical protein CSUI_009181 [Cystoisospora suis]
MTCLFRGHTRTVSFLVPPLCQVELNHKTLLAGEERLSRIVTELASAADTGELAKQGERRSSELFGRTRTALESILLKRTYCVCFTGDTRPAADRKYYSLFLFFGRTSFLIDLVNMRLRLASAGTALVAVVLSTKSGVFALRHGSQHSVRAMDAEGVGAVECKEGQRTLAIRAANDTVSFKCGENLILFPAFMETGMQAYASANSTDPVLLTSIVPGAKFTQSIATQRPESPNPAANDAPAGGDSSAGGRSTATYYLTAPELPHEEKTVVFKCSKSSVPTAPPSGRTDSHKPDAPGSENPNSQTGSSGSSSDTSPQQGDSKNESVQGKSDEPGKVSMLSKSSSGQEQAPASEGCVMIINVAKSAASIAATPIAAASSIALTALAFALALEL